MCYISRTHLEKRERMRTHGVIRHEPLPCQAITHFPLSQFSSSPWRNATSGCRPRLPATSLAAMAASCSLRSLWRAPPPDLPGSHGLARLPVLPGSHDVGPPPDFSGSHGVAPRQRTLTIPQSLTTAGRLEREEGGSVQLVTSAILSPVAIDDSRSDHCFFFFREYTLTGVLII
jgi:hypothetical protein